MNLRDLVLIATGANIIGCASCLHSGSALGALFHGVVVTLSLLCCLGGTR